MNADPIAPPPPPPAAQAATLLTLGEIARAFGVRVHRVKYAIDAADVRPVQRAGILRLFAREDRGSRRRCGGSPGAGGAAMASKHPSIPPVAHGGGLDLSPDRRLDELAALLATGLRRWLAVRVSPALTSPSPSPTESTPDHLEVPGETSLHGPRG